MKLVKLGFKFGVGFMLAYTAFSLVGSLIGFAIAVITQLFVQTLGA